MPSYLRRGYFHILQLCDKCNETKTVPEQPTIQTEPLSLIVEASAPSTDILPEEEPAPTPELEPLATREEIELLALCAMAEAEGECEQGQRLVIDSVLNRVDNPHFPDTISEVIWQKTSMRVCTAIVLPAAMLWTSW